MEGLAGDLPVNLFRLRGRGYRFIGVSDTVGMAVVIEGTLKGFVHVCKLHRIRHEATWLALTTARAALWIAIGSSVLRGCESYLRGWGAREGTGARWTK